MKSCLGELNGTFMVMRIGRYPQIAVNAGDIVSGGACPFPGWDGKASSLHNFARATSQHRRAPPHRLRKVQKNLHLRCRGQYSGVSTQRTDPSSPFAATSHPAG